MRRVIDICMTAVLLLLMAYQVTGEVLHEWIGIGMTVLVVVHQILNRKWYGAVFKGKYNPYRTVTTAVNILLLLSFVMTAFSGMSMSSHAVPFLYGAAPVSFARKMHLAMSHWSFVLMGIHLGLHIPVMTAKMKIGNKAKTAIAGIFCIAAGIGLFLFLRNKWSDYMFFRSVFAFLDYEKAGALVVFENLVMLTFWAFIGSQTAAICRKRLPAKEEQASKAGSRLIPVVLIAAALIIGMALSHAFPANSNSFGNTGWNSGGKANEPASQTDASIPMPIASFLEEYDFAGKRIIPFCSHGGGRFGQSLTAIAKLAPP